MRIYSFQPRKIVDLIEKYGCALVDLEETNAYKLSISSDLGGAILEPYFWMARKLGEKTDLWMNDVYGNDLDLPKDSEGRYLDAEGERLPVFPFWGWYIVDGANQRPDPMYYSFGDSAAPCPFAWDVSGSASMLLTLDIPEECVLLSDANAWYCVLQCRPCYEYESEDVERLKTSMYENAMHKVAAMPERTRQEKAVKDEAWQALLDECIRSWDNIFRLEGRRLRPIFHEKERYDIQAVFPMIKAEWLISAEEL